MTSIDKNWVDTHVDSNGEVVIPEGVQVIKKGAFQGNDKVKRIIMPDSIIGIEPRAFAECPNLQEANLSSNLQILGMNAFRNCTQLKSITIPDKVKTIYPGTFEGNANLESITLNGSLDYFSVLSLSKCDKLEEITINGTQRIDYGTFLNKSSVKRIRVDVQEVTLDENQTLLSLQKTGEKVVVVVKGEKGAVSTKAINLERGTSATVSGNMYLGDDGKPYRAITSLAVASIVSLENAKKSGDKKVFIYGGEHELTPDEKKMGMNPNLYDIDDLIAIKTKIEELKKQITVPGKNEPDRDKKIYGQIVRVLSQNIVYDQLENGEADGRSEEVVHLENRNLMGLIRGSGVCQGYAEIVRNLSAEYGIQVESVRGSNGQESHEWNQVKLDGIWYDDDFTSYRKMLVNGDLDECHSFLIGSKNGESLTKRHGYTTSQKIHAVGVHIPINGKKNFLNYGRTQQQVVQPHEKERPPEESIKDEVGDETKPKTQSQQQDEQQAEAIWMNRLQTNNDNVAKMQDGAKKQQDVVKLIQDLDREHRQDRNQQIQEENQNNGQGR